MIFRQREYVRGEMVGNVDLGKLFGPLEVPVTPRRWYMLRVFNNRELKVMRKFEQRNISAWLPTMTSSQYVTRHLRGYHYVSRQNVTSPLITGVVLIPDFEVDAERWKDVDGTIELLRFGEFTPSLTPKLFDDLRKIEAIGNTPKTKRGRAFEIGQLVRVLNGPFALFSARVERFDSKGRLSVGVEIFGRITPIQIDESDIEAVKAR